MQSWSVPRVQSVLKNALKEEQVVIITCMTTRAVHLEPFTDKTSGAILMVFHGFAYLRGHPSVCC